MYDCNCAKCGGLVPAPMEPYGYAGRYCHCGTPTGAIPVTSVEQIIARQEKDFEQKWEHGDVIDTFVTYKENGHSIIDRKKVRNWHSSSIKEILEGVVKSLPEKKKSGCGCPPFQSTHDGACWQEEFEGEGRGYNKAITDTINYIEEIIKKL